MTTLVYRSGVLAADSRGTSGGWVLPSQEKKLRKLPDGRLVGSFGPVAGVARLINWLETGEPGDQPDIGDSNVVVVSADAIHVFSGEGRFDEPVTGFHAWGSGMPPALAALHMGADACEAVRIACLVDPSSGGPVQSVRLAA